jgi:hypothetical protein
VQETPEAALVAAQAYLLTTQPKPRDPREHMHQAAIRSLGLVEDKLRKHLPEKKATYHKEKDSSANLRKMKQASCQAMKSVKHERRTQEI